MLGRWTDRLLVSAAALGVAIVGSVSTHSQKETWLGVLDEHPAIQYATRPTGRRFARHAESRHSRRAAPPSRCRAPTRGGSHRLPSRSVLRMAMGAVPVDSQLLVFSKTGVQARLYEPHQSARAVFRSVRRRRLRSPGGPACWKSAARTTPPQQGGRLLHARSDGRLPRLRPPAQLA